MDDFLSRLVGRIVGDGPLVDPLIRSRYAPEAQPATLNETVVDAPAAATRPAAAQAGTDVGAQVTWPSVRGEAVLEGRPARIPETPRAAPAESQRSPAVPDVAREAASSADAVVVDAPVRRLPTEHRSQPPGPAQRGKSTAARASGFVADEAFLSDPRGVTPVVEPASGPVASAASPSDSPGVKPAVEPAFGPAEHAAFPSDPPGVKPAVEPAFGPAESTAFPSDPSHPKPAAAPHPVRPPQPASAPTSPRSLPNDAGLVTHGTERHGFDASEAATPHDHQEPPATRAPDPAFTTTAHTDPARHPVVADAVRRPDRRPAVVERPALPARQAPADVGSARRHPASALPALAQPPRGPGREEPTPVHVTIGRIEVRAPAVQPALPAAPAAPVEPVLSLGEYLRTRGGVTG
jgi:hypothetical protein